MRLSIMFFSGLFLFILGTLNVQAKNIYGLHEVVQLPEFDNLKINSKLDTGALTSSFGATDIQFFDRDGAQWVRFKPQIKSLDLPYLEKKLVRHSKIKNRSDELNKSKDSSYSKRPVVIIDICFDGVVYPTEVNLTDRSRFNYPLLLGSSTLSDYGAVIDPSLKYQSKTKCKL